MSNDINNPAPAHTCTFEFLGLSAEGTVELGPCPHCGAEADTTELNEKLAAAGEPLKHIEHTELTERFLGHVDVMARVVLVPDDEAEREWLAAGWIEVAKVHKGTKLFRLTKPCAEAINRGVEAARRASWPNTEGIAIEDATDEQVLDAVLRWCDANTVARASDPSAPGTYRERKAEAIATFNALTLEKRRAIATTMLGLVP